MALPNPNMDFIPGDILRAQELDDMHANILSLESGSGIKDGAVTPEKLADSDWVDINIATDYEPNGSYPCQVRKIGKICHMQGRIEKTSGVIQAGGDRHMANLPVGFAPSINQHIKAQCGGVTGGRLMINADGTIKCNPETNTPYVFINTSWIVG